MIGRSFFSANRVHARCRTYRQIEHFANHHFVDRHSIIAIRTTQRPITIAMQGDLDKIRKTCYLMGITLNLHTTRQNDVICEGYQHPVRDASFGSSIVWPKYRQSSKNHLHPVGMQHHSSFGDAFLRNASESHIFDYCVNVYNITG